MIEELMQMTVLSDRRMREATEIEEMKDVIENRINRTQRMTQLMKQILKEIKETEEMKYTVELK